MNVRATLMLASMFLLSMPNIALAAECPRLSAMKRHHFWSTADQWRCELCGFNHLKIGRGRSLKWNGRSIKEDRLRTYLRLVRQINPQPVTLILVDKRVDCREIEHVFDIVAQETPCDGRLCRYAMVERVIRR